MRALKNFIHNAESLTQIIYAWRIIPQIKNVIDVQCFLLPKTIRYGLNGSRNITCMPWYTSSLVKYVPL